MVSRGGNIGKYSSTFFRFMVGLLIFTFFLPAPMVMTAQANENPDTAHVQRRFNGPERARAIEEAARQDAAARAAYAEQEAAQQERHPGGSGERHSRAGGNDGMRDSASAFRPKSLAEVLFNHGAAFMGVPGLAPQRGTDGNFDEGLGFHQDGTVRRAGGADSASGYGGKRAASYMSHGMGYGQGNMQGIGYGPYGNGMYDAMHQELWGRDDPTRGGRVTGGMGGMSGSYDNFDPLDAAMQRGLNYGLGLLNSAGEAALSGLVDGGRARLNFSIDWDGRVNGEGDVLLPFWDSQYTTIYTQLGARSMSGMDGGGSDGEGADRWIGNAGLGQRWFPFAESLTDAGNLMLGYNAFYDYDFTRSHQRGGFGIEAQYDWIRLASNYYFPISSWRDSKDFDGDFVKERAAEGWDVRVKGYLPFYRNLAVTGAYSQWYGDHVGMFSSSKLEKDPKVWSYGLEYTPVPLVSGFVNQRSTENGRSDTEFGLRFTYHFNMPWEDQISHAKVAELRTVSGSRHEFVDRENRIILEYKAKNSYRIEYVGPDGANGFLFRIRDGFGKYVAGQTVRVTTSGTYLAEAAPAGPQTFFAKALNFLDELISVKAAYAADFSKTYVTDGQGRFWVQLDSSAPASTQVTVQAGDNSQTFTLAGGGSTFAITLVAGTPVAGVSGSSVMTATVTNGGTPVSGQNVVFTWKVKGGGQSQQTGATSGTDASGEATYTLNGSGDQRTITVTATLQSDNSKTDTADVQFGAALPSGFIALAGSSMNWSEAGSYCTSQGGKLPRVNNTNSYPTSSYIGNELVDGFGSINSAWPSGLPGAFYWTGTVDTDYPGNSWSVTGLGGSVLAGFGGQSVGNRVVCVP